MWRPGGARLGSRAVGWATQIVGSAIYDVAALGYRPHKRDLLVAIGALLAYAILITPINLGFSLNYGYIGDSRPESPTLIDKLGPWPWRLVPMMGLAFGVFVIAWAVWAIPAWMRGRNIEPESPLSLIHI